MMNKVVKKDVSKSIEKVVLAVKNHLRANGFSNEQEMKSAVENFLKRQKLKKVAVNSRAYEDETINFYLRFSFDGTIIENTTICKKLKKH